MNKELKIKSKDIQFIVDNFESLPKECTDLLMQIKVEKLNNLDSSYYFRHLGIYCINNGDYFGALKNWKRSLSIAQDYKFVQLIDIGHLSLSAIYYYTQQHRKAIHHAFIAYRSNDIKVRSSACQNLALVYEITENFEKAMHYNSIAIDLSEELNRPEGCLAALVNVGNILVRQGKEVEALSYFQRAVGVTRDANRISSLSDAYIYLADYYSQIEDHKNANQHAEQSLEYARKSGVKRNYPQIYKVLISSNYLLGDIKTAREKIAEYQLLEIYDGDYKSREAIFDLLIEIEEKFNGPAAGLIAAKDKLAFLKRRREETEKQTAVYNQFKEDEQEQIEIANKKLEISNREFLEIAKILAHDIKTPVRTLGSFSKLLKKELNDLENPLANEYLDFITEASKTLYSKLESSLSLALMELSVPLVNVDMNEGIVNVKKQFESLTVNVKNELPIILSNTELINSLFKHLLANASEYNSKVNPQIDISSQKNSDFVSILFEDNGNGISESDLDKIFDIFYSSNQNEKKGIGLTICKKIADLHEGGISVKSNLANGTIVKIDFPIKYLAGT